MPEQRRSATPPSGEVLVTRQVHFSASHRLFNPAFGKDWNRRHFGECSNQRGHGHNYVLEVTVAGRPHPETGYVMDLRDLKRLLTREIVSACDHRHLNDDVPFLKGVIPSTENLTVAFWKRIERKIKGGRLHRVRLYETPRNYADYFGS